jgi:hypothetical protein
MTDTALELVETTPAKSSNRNLLLVGWDPDATISRKELAREWVVSTKTLKRYQDQGLPWFEVGGETSHIVRSAREFMRARERRTKECRRASRRSA